MKRIFLFTAICLIPLALFCKATLDTVLIKNATIVPVTEETIQPGDLLIKEGKIARIGKGIPSPAGAEVIDASGMSVYPGFIDAYSLFGLVEISAIASTVDTNEMGKINPELKVVWAINPHSVHFATNRINGTTTALVALSGGTFSGAVLRVIKWRTKLPVQKSRSSSTACTRVLSTRKRLTMRSGQTYR